jgi:hypothetical protein
MAYEVIRDDSVGFIYSITGICPVQAYGLIGTALSQVNLGKRSLEQLSGHELYEAISDMDGNETRIPPGTTLFYFRERHKEWRFDINWHFNTFARGRSRYGGAMPFSIAEQIIRDCIQDYLAAKGS